MVAKNDIMPTVFGFVKKLTKYSITLVISSVTIET